MKPVYAKFTRYGGTCYAEYCGQTQELVTSLLTELGATDIQFITAEEYSAAQGSGL